jgi:plasmid stabilization system protein ParE
VFRCKTCPKDIPPIQRENGEVIRRKVHGQYLIFYTVASDRIEIVRVIHGAQDYARFFD